MTFRTAAQIRDQLVSLMGAPLGAVYNSLWQEVAGLFHVWGEYDELFGKKSSRVTLLNEAAPTFFRLVQDTLWESVILNIARLTDRPTPGGKPALTIQRLPSLIADPVLRASVERLVDAVLVEAEFCRDWRNRHIAHRDLNLAIDEAARPLDSATREKVRRVLACLAKVLNELQQFYRSSETAFDFHSVHAGAESLLYVIDDGITAGVERKKRLQDGQWTQADIKPRDL